MRRIGIEDLHVKGANLCQLKQAVPTPETLMAHFVTMGLLGRPVAACRPRLRGFPDASQAIGQAGGNGGASTLPSCEP
jgi:hypothetical protein